VRPLVAPTHPLGSPGLSPHTGPLAAAAWLAARELSTRDPRWSVDIVLDAAPAATFEPHDASTRFHIEIYSEEWGYSFRHQRRTSWIRVTDIPFVHGRDDHQLLIDTPKLREIGKLVRTLERRYRIALRQHPPLIRTSLPNAEAVIRGWATDL